MSAMRRRKFVWSTAAGLFAAGAGVASAQAYPGGSAPIRFVLAYPPGGSSDFLTRLVGRMLSESLKHTVIVDNRPGGNTIIAAENVAKSKPDGYTIYLIGALTHGSLKWLNEKLPFDPIKDFTGITNLIDTPLVLSVPPQSPINSLKELIDYAKAHPGEVNFGSAGLGNTLHLAGEMFARQAKVKLNHVQYKGSSQAVLDLMAGRIQMMFDVPQTTLPHIQGGKLKALAVTSGQRIAMLPEVPTLMEAGLPSYRFLVPIGVAAPAGMPAPILDRLYTEIRKIAGSPEFRKAVEAQAMFAAPSESPAAFQNQLQESQNIVGDLLNISKS